MKSDNTNQKISWYFNEINDRTDSLSKQYMELIDVLTETNNATTLLRVLGDIKTLLKRTEVNLSSMMIRLNEQLNYLTDGDQHSNSEEYILSPEEVKALIA